MRVLLSPLSKLPGKDKLIAKVVQPIHRAANVITLKDYAVRCFAP